ncbi:hypothetical protein BDF20DRAFT_945792 [Mycotypha africana]|uniref:uncharacterized protein n=1 Tax=Mycotypha africana TaxID=64632 RepID=UPI0023015618|nr:uncharacterized protein BDF20DRAFT_945792 [Mycotypha africana]KAI8973314.1 hypothetical protein BDF20DRAFT_945792 [Mycotypha africana]
MSWDSPNNNSSAGQPDFSSGNVGWGSDNATGGNVDFSSGNAGWGADSNTAGGNADFSSGNAGWGADDAAVGNNFANAGGNDFSNGNGFGGATNDFSNGTAASKYANNDAYEEARTERPPRAEPTEEQLQHRNYNWASNRARYEYNENAIDANGMAPRDAALEQELFEENAAEQQTTLDFSKYASIPVRVERGTAPPPIKSFEEADLHPVMKENVRLARYTAPTPVQMHSIPIVTSGKDLMACAQTGSGKTAAFLVPTLSALFSRAKELQKPRPAPYETRTYKAEPLVLIIAPTRELCSQIFDECRRFTYRSPLRPCAIYGGADSFSQLRQLERGCDVLAAAPGRLMDYIQRGKIGLNRIKYLVLDEADRMLDMGFEAIIRNIILKNDMPTDRQTLLYSATFPRAIRALARDFLKPDYLFLKVGRVGGTSSAITQNIMYVPEEDKREALRTLLNSQPPSRTLIFVETKRSADSLDQYLFDRGFPSTSIHGDRTQMEREDALLAFKRGKCPILVATAVAARGIDIRNVMHVVNYDMPQDMDEYIHRIGRTARVGKSGLATSFYNERSDLLAPELTKLLKECKQNIPDFLEQYVTDDMTFDEDLDDTGVEAPSYAGQEYVPMERTAPGAPQGYNNAEATGAADAAWDSGNTGGHSGAREGDWDCPDCATSNYASRFKCFKCGTPNPNGGSGGGRPGDWNCPDCGISNFASRYECFKCGVPKPEGLGGGDFGGGRRPPRERREGDWDCSSCGAVNFASRFECFKCSAPKESDGAGFNSGYGGYDNNTTTDTSNLDSANWDSTAATAGWSAEPAVNASSNDAAWGASTETPADAAPAPATGEWGASNDTPAAAAPPAPANGGWGASNDTLAAAAPPAPANGGWGASNYTPAQAAPAASGWGAPAQAAEQPKPTTPPPAAAGGWGPPAPTQPSPAPEASTGWGAPTQQTSPAPAQSMPTPAAASGWGAPAQSTPNPAKSASPAPVQQHQQQQAPAQAAPANDDGWGTAPAVSADGWGAPPAQSSGPGW